MEGENRMIWPIIFCSLVLAWGIYWSIPNDKSDVKERIARLEVKVEHLQEKLK